jgi:hypothetical protein
LILRQPDPQFRGNPAESGHAPVAFRLGARGGLLRAPFGISIRTLAASLLLHGMDAQV